MIDVSAAVFIFVIALMGVILFLLGIRIGQKGKLDPLDPLVPHDIPFRDRTDFVERVAKPMMEIDGESERELMKLYNQASPYFICVCLVMMDNAIFKMKERLDHLESPR